MFAAALAAFVAGVFVLQQQASLPAQVDRGLRFEFEVEQIEEPGLRVPRRLSLAWSSSVAAVLPGER